ncbi:MAG: homoserine kinase [Pelagibacteraceae bacterium]
MAVYTKINSQEIKNILSNFNAGKLDKYHGIKEGIENTNYFIKTNRKKIILTIFERRVNQKEIPFFVHLMKKLSESKIKCPKPFFNKKGNAIFKYKNKSAIMVSFLEGNSKKKLNYNDCQKIGFEIAKLHFVAKKIKIKRKNSLSFAHWVKIFSKVKKFYPKLQNEIKTYFSYYKKNRPKSLQSGIIHADIFPDNIFFKKNKFSGFIDFYFACNAPYIYEIAIAINSLCFNKNKFDPKKVKYLIKGYTKKMKINKKELIHLNTMCLGAAIRFFVTRLYDLKNTPKKARVKKKSPIEYLKKMKFFYQNRNHQLYV